MFVSVFTGRRSRRKRERTRSAGTRRAAGSSFFSPPAAEWGFTRRVREHREFASAVARTARGVLPSPRNDRIRRADRARRVHAARSRRTPSLVHAGGVLARPRGVSDPAWPARGPACDVARIRAPGVLGRVRRGGAVHFAPVHHRERGRRPVRRVSRDDDHPGALLRRRSGGHRVDPSRSVEAGSGDGEGRAPVG